MRIRLTVALVLILLVGPSACVLFSDCKDVKPHFVIEGLTAYNAKFGVENYIQPNEIVPWDIYLLRFFFDQRFITTSRDPFGTSVMALADCLPAGYDGTKSGLDTLYVISETNYNASIQMGDTVNSLIRAGAIYQGLDELGYFITDSKTKIRDSGIDFQLTEPPLNQNTSCRFKVSIVLQDGSKFVTTAPDVTLTWQ